MPDQNGFMTIGETRQEFADAEARLLARPRSAYEIAGDLTPEEASATEAGYAALDTATDALAAARAELADANAAGEGWREPSAREAARIDDAERALRRATAAEEEARLDSNALQTRIGRARQERRNGADR